MRKNQNNLLKLWVYLFLNKRVGFYNYFVLILAISKSAKFWVKNQILSKLRFSMRHASWKFAEKWTAKNKCKCAPESIYIIREIVWDASKYQGISVARVMRSLKCVFMRIFVIHDLKSIILPFYPPPKKKEKKMLYVFWYNFHHKFKLLSAIKQQFILVEILSSLLFL